VSTPAATASGTRQQLLILCAASPDLRSAIVAWSLYDGAGDRTSISGDADVPPYESVLAAMRDGWRVLQLPATQRAAPGTEHETSFLKWEYVLERIVDVP
jgi:hypothetical protein